MSYYSSPQDNQQFELFTSPDDQNANKKKGLFSKKISLALEHVMIAVIVMLVICVVAFSMGVARGKRVAMDTMGALEINLAKSENDVIITPSSEEKNVSSVHAVVSPVAAVGKVSSVVPVQDIVVDVPVPAQTTTQAEAVTGVYTVQVASFKKSQFADQEVDILKKKGFQAFSVAKGGFYLVCVGKYETKSQAQKTSKSLKSKYQDNVIRRL